MDKLIELALNREIAKAKNDILMFSCNYGTTYIPLIQAVERYVYFTEWWIVFSNGFKCVWFTPFDFFVKTESYKPWCHLQREAIFNILNRKINE